MEDIEATQHQWRETDRNPKQTEKKCWSVCSKIVPTAISQCGTNTITTLGENTMGGGAPTAKNPPLL